jgi:hypothetical protein
MLRNKKRCKLCTLQSYIRALPYHLKEGIRAGSCDRSMGCDLVSMSQDISLLWWLSTHTHTHTHIHTHVYTYTYIHIFPLHRAKRPKQCKAHLLPDISFCKFDARSCISGSAVRSSVGNIAMLSIPLPPSRKGGVCLQSRHLEPRRRHCCTS